MQASYYSDLTPPPNYTAPNFQAWIEALATPEIETMDALEALIEAFDLYTAVGSQLDILGEIVGVSRVLPFPLGGGLNPVLDDDYYRIAIIAKCLFNIWKGTKNEIYDFWRRWLPEYPILIQDNQNMTMSVLVIGMPTGTDDVTLFGYDSATVDISGYDIGYWEGFQGVLREMVLNGYFVPKPAGVLVNYAFIDYPVFAYDLDNDYFKGYDQGTWPAFT